MNVRLVSNDEQFINILSFAISLKGHGMLIAKSQSETQTIINSSHEIIAVIAVDLILGGASNGLEIAHMVRASNPRIPIFLMVPYKDPMLAQEARNCGCVDIILRTQAIEDLQKNWNLSINDLEVE